MLYLKVEDKEGHNCSNMYKFVIHDYVANTNLVAVDGVFTIDPIHITLLLLANDHAPICGFSASCLTWYPQNLWAYVVKKGHAGLDFYNLDHFEISNIPSPQVANTPFSVTISAIDVNGKLMNGKNGTDCFNAICVFLSDWCDWSDGGNSRLLEPPFLEFNQGVWIGQCCVKLPTASITAKIRGGNVQSESNSFSVS